MATTIPIARATAQPRQVATRPVRGDGGAGGVGSGGGSGGALNGPRMPRIEVQRNAKSGRVRVSNQVYLVYPRRLWCYSHQYFSSFCCAGWFIFGMTAL